MAVKPIPDGHQTLIPYLIIRGVANEIDFLKEAFNAKELHRTQLPDGTVMHVQLKIGDSMLMMGEARAEWEAMPGSIYMYVEDTDKTYSQAINAGAISVLEPADQFYGDRNAGVKDPSGNVWWIATHIEDVSEEELHRRAEERMNL